MHDTGGVKVVGSASVVVGCVRVVARACGVWRARTKLGDMMTMCVRNRTYGMDGTEEL